MIPKSHQKSGASFVFTEVCIFLSQVFVIFLVAAFTSDFLRSETRLTEFGVAKINSHTMEELGLTLLAITVALGGLSIISTLTASKFVEEISNEVLQELPRTIYFFGSSITATTGAIAVFVASHPDSSTEKAASGFAAMTAFFAISFFAYGCGLKALLRAKSRKTAKQKQESSNTDAPSATPPNEQ